MLLNFSEIVRTYEKLEATSGRIEMTELLATLLEETPRDELSTMIYLTQGKLRPDFEGVELGVAEKLALRALVTASGLPPERVKKMYTVEGDIGSAAQKLLERSRQGSLLSQTLTLKSVYKTLLQIAKTSGEGSIENKLKLLVNLLNDSTPLEAKYILRTAMGVLRLGVADYTILDASAVALLGDKSHRAKLERAYNLTSDLGYVVELAAREGLSGVEKVHVQLGKPIRPMLAERLESARAIVEKLGADVAMEYKLDGERLQVHKSGGSVELFSRRLEKITHNYPDVVEFVRKYVKAKDAILEGEVVAVNTDTGEYLPFQELMHRRRKHGVEEAMQRYPVALNFFELLFHNGNDCTNNPYSLRRKELEALIEETEVTRPVPARRTSSAAEIEDFMEQAISEGCEGLVVKDPRAVYRAGAREFSWIKLKREYASELTDTIDLVMIGAFHGKGRRAGVYGTYLLAAYDDKRGVFTSITKVGTGFSDQDLERFPKLLKDYKSSVKPPNVESNLIPDVWYRPKVVMETIASEITLSPIHPAGFGSVREGSGLALRFPKFTGKIRDDKSPEDATTVTEVIKMYKMQLKKVTK